MSWLLLILPAAIIVAIMRSRRDTSVEDAWRLGYPAMAYTLWQLRERRERV